MGYTDNRYRKPTPSEAKALSRSYADIAKTAKFISENFLGKRLVYDLADDKKIELVIKKRNFAHLCGIKYLGRANAFYRLAEIERLDKSRILVKKDGSTFLKLQALPLLSHILDDGIQVVGHGSMLYLKYDAALRTKNDLFALTLVNPNNSDFFVPESLLNLRTMTYFPSGVTVQEIHIEDMYDSND